ncbi:MAG: sigma-70 family RNA polymerase sigma factor [Gaiella sp.]|nr:sigma-70 family RNA polymerase sigma factor [Gaiella sp.]
MAATETSTRAKVALDDLYRHHVGEVYRYTYAVLGNHADAEDVTQTTFVNAFRALERGESPRNASGWLIAIAQNVVRQRWRHAASRPAEVELVQDVPDAPEEPDVELDELVRALQRIPPTQREALVLRELEGRSYSEIAELLGLTTSALETLLFRARRSLAEELESLVTCQSAELAMSKQLDGRLGRKERRRLEEHLAECPDCARLAEAQKRQRRAFKGLAVLPVPVGLALFKGAPSASAATGLPTIGVGATGSGTTTTAGTAGGTGAAAGGATATTGATAGGSLVAAAAKIAAVIVAATVVTGVAYKGIDAMRDDASPSVAVKPAKAPPRAKAAGKTAAAAVGTATAGAPQAASSAGRGPKPAAAAGADATAPEPARRADGAAAGGVPTATQSPSPSAGTTPSHAPTAPNAGPQAPPRPPRSPAPKQPRRPEGVPDRPEARARPAAPAPAPAPVLTSPPAGSGVPPVTTPEAPPSSGPPTSTPTTPTTPAAPPTTPTAPATPGEQPGDGDGSSESTGCPGSGAGPGNGAGCGVGNGHGQDKGKGPGKDT